MGCILLLNLLAVAPALHELIHADAGQTQHQCAVTLFAHGKLGSACPVVSIPTPQILFEENLTAQFFAFSLVIETHPAGRAPPASCFNS